MGATNTPGGWEALMDEYSPEDAEAAFTLHVDVELHGYGKRRHQRDVLSAVERALRNAGIAHTLHPIAPTTNGAP